MTTTTALSAPRITPRRTVGQLPAPRPRAAWRKLADAGLIDPTTR